MPRLLIHVEGQTEETFVSEVLRPHLLNRGYTVVGARIVGHARQRGGVRAWPSIRKDIINHLREDQGGLATTMVDYYGLPQSGDRAWPGRAAAAHVNLDAHGKAQVVESAVLDELAQHLGKQFDHGRFIPFVVMHEFEGLLFSDCAAFSRGIYRPDLESKLQEIRDGFATPEEINDSPTTAPSKRVASVVPGYNKPLLGTLAALEIGLASIRSECPHFDSWLKQLEALGRAS